MANIQSMLDNTKEKGMNSKCKERKASRYKARTACTKAHDENRRTKAVLYALLYSKSCWESLTVFSWGLCGSTIVPVGLCAPATPANPHSPDLSQGLCTWNSLFINYSSHLFAPTSFSFQSPFPDSPNRQTLNWLACLVCTLALPDRWQSPTPTYPRDEILSVTEHKCGPSHQHSDRPIAHAYFMLCAEREKRWEKRGKVRGLPQPDHDRGYRFEP